MTFKGVRYRLGESSKRLIVSFNEHVCCKRGLIFVFPGSKTNDDQANDIFSLSSGDRD
jgi:hypothetical protein